jgi:hypothetical protein
MLVPIILLWVYLVGGLTVAATWVRIWPRVPTCEIAIVAAAWPVVLLVLILVSPFWLAVWAARRISRGDDDPWIGDD